ncbi:MAG: hypothetical protein ACRDN0_17065, partial [Trebonia sp.]
MSYPEPPRRPRYPALAQYEDDFQSAQPYQGAPPARAPWEEETRYQGVVEPGQPYAPPWQEETRYQGIVPPGQSYAPWEKPTRANSAPQAQTPWDMADPREQGSGEAWFDEGERRGPGLLSGGVAGFLAAAVALGIANLVAAFVRPQASPIIAVGGAFIDRTPPALKNFAVEKFGENDKTMLLLGMYVTIAIIAIVIGMIAWRHVSIGVLGIGLFGLFGAFVAITRPESQTTDVIPSLVGGIAGIIAIVLLVRMG